MCPDNTHSNPKSSAITECQCKQGYSVSEDGVVCTECEAGTYKNEEGIGHANGVHTTHGAV